MSWILENIYIVAVIAFFLISALGKRNKGNENRSPRVPGYGGEGEHREASGRADAYPETSYGDAGQDGYEEDRGNGYSLENEELNRGHQGMHREPDSMDRRMQMMQSDLDRIHSQLDRIGLDVPETILEVTDTDEQIGSRRSELAEQARNGIVWAEILGPSRAKRPLGRR
ncbi:MULTISPECIES: hypothetical protein [Paenibacillus]|uniref:Uncharacterized protein n=1 Tax=Paenibacillus campinasensis TaxID=66347 RepID=A0A268F4M5_9BACL|nr:MULTISPECIES: hypothetical protein [Paenibacillus]MUG64600.1 hypothetical protein [Paenibacillus campinasensis]PAD80325.1 hypothetical protein CHH67_01040 [Paenibacillus campinasensis]PAK55308.1 hypothetical protein CHH75_03360 [Paenibacillus sp. 7541]